MRRHTLMPINLYFHSNKREWRARYMDNGIKKAKHFSCKRYRERRSFFLASVFMRALSEYHDVPSDDFISYWALRTDTFEAFDDGHINVQRMEAAGDPQRAIFPVRADVALRDKTSSKDFRFGNGITEPPTPTGLADSIADYKLVVGKRDDSGGTTPCMIRHDSSGDLLSETSREESDISSDSGSVFKEELGLLQPHDDPRVKNSIFYDGDFPTFLQRQKLLLRVIEDLRTSLFVSKPSVDFVPKIDLESIEREFIVVDQKLLGARGVKHALAQPIRPRTSDEGFASVKRACTQLPDRCVPHPPEYTLERALKNCAESSPDDRLEKSVHLQKLVNLLSGEHPAEVYTNEILGGINAVKTMCAKTHVDFGPRSFYSPSLRHPIDSLSETSSHRGAGLDKQLFTDNTLYSAKNSFMLPKNIMGYMNMAKHKDDALNGSDDEDGGRLRIPRMSNSKLAHFVESLCGVNFDQNVIKNSLEQNAKECCDLRSLIQLCHSEGETNGEENDSIHAEEYFSNTPNHLSLIDGLETTAVTYYNNRILPNDAMDFYFNAAAKDYKKANLVRLQGGGPLDVSPDTFTAFDNRRQNMSHYLEAISALEERIREIQGRSEKMHKALHHYSQREHGEGINGLQEVLNLETLLFVSDTLMETKRRLHNELKRRVQDELDMINHILPEPLADSLTRILYPSVNC